MGNCYSNKSDKCIRTYPYMGLSDECNLTYKHYHCDSVISDSLDICDTPIYWWRGRCPNPKCNSNTKVYKFNEDVR